MAIIIAERRRYKVVTVYTDHPQKFFNDRLGDCGAQYTQYKSVEKKHVNHYTGAAMITKAGRKYRSQLTKIVVWERRRGGTTATTKLFSRRIQKGREIEREKRKERS